MNFFSLLPRHLRCYLRTYFLASELDLLWASVLKLIPLAPDAERLITLSSYCAKYDYLLILQQYQQLDYATIATVAAKYGQLRIMDWCRKCAPTGLNAEEICTAAVLSNQASVLQWCKIHDYRLNDDMTKEAAEHDSLDVLIWAHKNNYHISSLGIFHAASDGKLAIIKWFLEVVSPACSSIIQLCIRAACNEHVELVKWLRPRVSDAGCVEMLNRVDITDAIKQYLQ